MTKEKRENEDSLQKEIEARVSALVDDGALMQSGIEKLFQQVQKEFKKDIEKMPFLRSKKAFAERVRKLVWAPKRVKMLEEVVQHDLSPAVFCQGHPFIPEQMVKEQMRWLTGMRDPGKGGPRGTIPGLGRLEIESADAKTIARFRTPQATFQKPYEVPANSERWSAMWLNGTNIGLAYKRANIEHNIARRAFADARKHGDAAIVLTNFFDVDVTKASGPNKVYRALVSGLRTKPDRLPESYREEARRILENQKLTNKDIELVYVTFSERFDSIMEAWDKVTHRPKGGKPDAQEFEPEFNGPVLVILGYKEELLIAAAAYAEARYSTIKKQHEIDIKIKIAKHNLADARKNESIAEVRTFINELEDLRDLKARTIISNVGDDFHRTLHEKMRAAVVKKIEATIPNSAVIGVGSSHIKIGDHVVCTHIPDSLGISRSLLSNFVAGHGPRVLRGEMAPTTVICHPHALYYAETAREVDAEGKRGSARIYVAPVALDDVFLRHQLGNTVRKVHPVSKLAFSEQFAPGVFRLDYNNGMANGYAVPVSSLDPEGSGAKNAHLPLMADPRAKYIYLLSVTDPHYGSRNREQMWCEEKQQFVGVEEALFHLMRRSKLCGSANWPIHMSVLNDDVTQGNHFQVQQQPHPHELPLWDIEERWRALRRKMARAGDRETMMEIMREAQRFTLRQFAVRPPDWYQNQLRLACQKHVDANIDIFRSIVNKATKTGLVFRGMSHFEGTDGDGRDLGCINCGTGNHALKTLNRENTEGWIIAERMILRLLADQDHKEWHGKEAELTRLVKSPLYSNRFMAWGTMQAPDGYEYAFDLRDTVPVMKGWNDPLAGWIAVDPSRGNVQRFAERKYIIKGCGDKHFHANSRLPYALYTMFGPGTHTDLFGEFGFPPNNTGITVVGIPKDGPDSAPFIVRYFAYDQLKRSIEDPKREFDWDAYFPNPL